MSAKKLIDLSYLAQTTSNDKEFMLEMIDIFIKQTPIELENLQKSTHRKDWETVSRIAHTLKSNMKLMGAHTLREYLVKLEITAKNGTQEALLSDLSTHVLGLSKQVINELKDYQANIT
jgi:HPt (histidine-containing phosphotransfer) domain-containing protein